MCGIAGVVTQSRENGVGGTLKQMLQAMKHRGPDGAGFVIDGLVERGESLEELNFERKGHIALGHIRLAITGDYTGMQPFQSYDGQIALLHNGEIYNYQDLQKKLAPDFKFLTGSDSEVLLRLIEREYKGNLCEAVEKVLPELDGVYAIAVTDNKQTVLARDKIGVRQLYYYNNGRELAFASEKKPLLAISSNHSRINRLKPGHMAILQGSNIQHTRFWAPDTLRGNARIEGRMPAFSAYGRVVFEAIQKRVSGRKHVGIIFSGGIDSILVAYIVKKLGVPFTCYASGRADSVDVEFSKKVAECLGFPLKIKILSLENIAQIIPQVITDIEDHSLNQVEVAIPIYTSIRMAQEAGERVILNGQGADELFGGYPWYAKIVDREGYASFERYSWEDTFLLYKECLEREDKISMAHSMELRVPYLDPEVIKVAFQIAPKLKVKRDDDQMRKHVHREFCVLAGIPKDISFRKKEAAQHGANIHNALIELSGRMRISEGMLKAAGYDINVSVREKLGSSSRYGYRYGGHKLWKPLPVVQYYLDTRAESVNMLPEPSLEMLMETTKKLSREA